MTQSIWLYLFLLLLALASWWLSELLAPVPESRPFRPEHTIDYYARHFTTTVMNEEGAPKYKLSAEFMQHFSDDESSELEKPVLILYDANTPPWIVRSATGTLSKDGEEVFLGGDVFIDRAGSDQKRPVKVITRNLIIQPNKEYAETDEKVDIFSLGDHVTGVGMRAYFGNNVQISLLSNVRGTHEIP